METRSWHSIFTIIAATGVGAQPCLAISIEKTKWGYIIQAFYCNPQSYHWSMYEMKIVSLLVHDRWTVKGLMSIFVVSQGNGFYHKQGPLLVVDMEAFACC